MIGLDLLLIDPNNIEAHLANLSAAILEPEDVDELIDIQVILLRVALEQFGLREDVVLRLLLFFFIDEVVALARIMRRFSHVWRNADEVVWRCMLLVALRSIVLRATPIIHLLFHDASLLASESCLLLIDRSTGSSTR